ncbi:hypothetical protein ACFQMA_19465 [Halosimplex aquaticum]|uniref:PQQ-like domain-containing protein n=1 Tax=Halosimplex aquaticum TaxID=3026162 RepID=A0ABD5Y8G7_9EURY|nr:hypothetical protein [Halosimplex aquaticum]
MPSKDLSSRRAFLLGGASALAAGLAGCGGRSVKHGWLDVGAPVDGTLRDVVVTTAGPHAVGESGAIVARRSDTWETVVSDGPAGQSTGLYGVDVTDDGRRLWVAGSGGAAGAYDPASGEMIDFSGPAGNTSTWTDVAVSGRAGSERIALLNGSGELLAGRAREGTVRWSEVTKPTGGVSGTAVDAVGRTTVVTDSGGGVYGHTGPIDPTKPDEPGWKTVGIRGVETSLRDLVAVAPDQVEVVTDDGTSYRYDGQSWFRTDVADGSLHAIDRRGGNALTAGVDGAIYEVSNHQWERAETPTSNTLHGCAVATDSYADVAVGAGATILERFG